MLLHPRYPSHPSNVFNETQVEGGDTMVKEEPSPGSPDLTSDSDSEADSGSGRKRQRLNGPEDGGSADGAIKGERGADQNGDQDLSSKMRLSKKRARKSPEGKPHKCKFAGCGKSYTRAEHLHRHELNHEKPKTYVCERPNCNFTCVRKDLLDRHEERHMKPGSNLNRRDMQRAGKKKGHSITSITDEEVLESASAMLTDSPTGLDGGINAFRKPPPFLPQGTSPNSPASDQDMASGLIMPTTAPMAAFGFQQPHWSSAPLGSDPYGTSRMEGMSLASPTSAAPSQMWVPPGGPLPATQGLDGLGNNNNSPFNSNLDPIHGMSHDHSQSAPRSIVNNFSNGLQAFDATSPTSEAILQASELDWFTSQNFNHEAFFAAGKEHDGTMQGWHQAKEYEILENTAGLPQTEPPLDSASEASVGYNPSTISRNQTPFIDVLNPRLPDERIRSLIKYIEDEFEEPPPEAKKNIRIDRDIQESPQFFTVAEGNHTGIAQELHQHLTYQAHMIPHRLWSELSQIIENSDTKEKRLTDEARLAMTGTEIESYLTRYWKSFHPQVPILHKATVVNQQSSPGHGGDGYGDVPTLLLLTMIAIGAVMLDSTPDRPSSVDSAASLAQFLAWNIRGKLQNLVDYMCPTQTWVLQTLVLLETYEKLLSNRVMHERAQIHHTSTITLLRRGQALIPSDELPPDLSDSSPAWREFLGKPNKLWEDFIRRESLIRVAMAIFITDSMHALMFKHPAQLSPQELTRLPAPCDDALWECSRPHEFREYLEKQDSAIRASILKPKILNEHINNALQRFKMDESLRKNSFACKTVLAGLISSQHEFSRRGKLFQEQNTRRALRFWCDQALSKTSAGLQAQDVSDLRAMFCLAQVCMRTDVVALQRYSGAPRLLGRDVKDEDRKISRIAVSKWAGRENARIATLSGLHFLADVSKEYSSKVDIGRYNPRDDPLLYRPWAIYVSMLCAWAHIYTVEGAVPAPHRPNLGNSAELVRGANSFLERVSVLKSAEDLRRMPGRNRCIGLLQVLSNKMRGCRWGLLIEAANRLKTCANLLDGREPEMPFLGRMPGVEEMGLDEEKVQNMNFKKNLFERQRKALRDQEKEQLEGHDTHASTPEKAARA